MRQCINKVHYLFPRACNYECTIYYELITHWNRKKGLLVETVGYSTMNIHRIMHQRAGQNISNYANTAINTHTHHAHTPQMIVIGQLHKTNIQLHYAPIIPIQMWSTPNELCAYKQQLR